LSGRNETACDHHAASCRQAHCRGPPYKFRDRQAQCSPSWAGASVRMHKLGTEPKPIHIEDTSTLISRKEPTRCGRAPPPDDRTPHTTATTGPGHPTPRSGGISCHGLTHPAASHHVPAASRPAVNWPLDQAPPVRGHLLRPRASHAPRRRDALLLPDTAAPERRTHHSRPQARAAICGTTLRDHVPPNDDSAPPPGRTHHRADREASTPASQKRRAASTPGPARDLAGRGTQPQPESWRAAGVMALRQRRDGEAAVQRAAALLS